MKKKVLLSALLSGVMLLSATAQEYQPQVGFSNEAGKKVTFKRNNGGDNWFISIAGGASMLGGDNNEDADFTNRLNFAPQIAVGKWVNPYRGYRLQINGGAIHGFENDATIMRHHHYVNAHFDFLWDMTNYFGAYNEAKIFRFIPWVGIGYAQRFKTDATPADIRRTENPSINFGILMPFRLSKRIDFTLEGSMAFMSEEFNRVHKAELIDYVYQVNAGLTFKLGRTDFEVVEPMDYALLNDLNSQINNLRAQNTELSKRPVSCPECPPAAVQEVVNNYIENVVRFRINSAKIESDQQVNIYNTAEFMKANNVPIKVIGYADKKTGTSAYNMQLSEKRARAVAKELVDKYGISSNQITIEYKGSDVQPYNENNWNRVVIMTAND